MDCILAFGLYMIYAGFVLALGYKLIIKHFTWYLRDENQLSAYVVKIGILIALGILLLMLETRYNLLMKMGCSR